MRKIFFFGSALVLMGAVSATSMIEVMRAYGADLGLSPVSRQRLSVRPQERTEKKIDNI